MFCLDQNLVISGSMFGKVCAKFFRLKRNEQRMLTLIFGLFNETTLVRDNGQSWSGNQD